MRVRAASVLLALASCFCLGGSCPTNFAPIGRVDPTTLPEDGLECLRLADAWSQPGTSRDRKLDALVALDRALDLGADRYVAFVVRARVYFRLFEENEAEPAAGGWIDAGVAAARQAIAEREDRVEGHYYLAALMGRLAERSPVGALDMIPEIMAEAERSMELDRTYDRCGPILAVGMLYIAAPPWPQSIGDPETGIEYLREARECNDYPTTLIMLAEALLEQGEYVEARELVREALGRPPVGDWAIEGNHWRPIAREILERAEHPGQ